MRLLTLLSCYIRVRHGIGGCHEVHEARDDLGSGGDGAGNAPLGGGFGLRPERKRPGSYRSGLRWRRGHSKLRRTRTGDQATAKLLHHIVDTASSPTTVFTTGDNAYESGTLSEYKTCYGPQPTTDHPNWGEFKAITMPSPGNHEYYSTANASGYFDYFSAAPSAPVPNTQENPGLTPGKGYYSYDLGSWHVISLNSNCKFVAGEVAPPDPIRSSG